jgi:cell division protein FtsB
VTLLLGALLVAGSVAALFAERGYLDLRRSKRELERRRKLLHAQVEKVRLLRNQVAALENDPTAVERVAREDLGLVRDGEVLFLLPAEEGDVPDPEARD